MPHTLTRMSKISLLIGWTIFRMILIFMISFKCKIRVLCRINLCIMMKFYNIFNRLIHRNLRSKLNLEYWIKIYKVYFRILIHCLFRIQLYKIIKIFWFKTMIKCFIKNCLIIMKTKYNLKILVYLIIYSRTQLINKIFWV
jgi:hypothetical protein